MKYDNYQKVLDSLFYVKEKPSVIERLDELFENIIKPSVMLTLAETAIRGLVRGYGLAAGSSGKTRASEVSKTREELAGIKSIKTIIAGPSENRGGSTGCATVYQKQVNAYAGRDR